MPTAQPSLNLNQFSQQPILGQLALGIGSFPLVIQAVISANQASALTPGQAVKFDAAVTSTPSGLPPIVACAQTAYADGYVLYDVKNQASQLIAATVIQIVLDGILWMLVENTTVDVGVVVEDGADAGTVEPLGTTGSSFPRGISLDYGTVGQLIRVHVQPAVTKVTAAAA